MMRSSYSAAAMVAALCVSSVAGAHIELLEPPPRYERARSGDNKACPCGDGTSNRTCANADERSDDNRSTNITALTAGQTLTLRFDEYVGHSGRYRVAFDVDGADLSDFNAHPLEDIPDPPGKEGNTGEGSIWEISVEVPDTACDNCTLQLIQMMDGNMEDLVDDPVGRSSYYACADITITAAEGSAAESSDEGAVASASTQPDAGGCSMGRAAPLTFAHAAVLAASALFIALRRRARRLRPD